MRFTALTLVLCGLSGCALDRAALGAEHRDATLGDVDAFRIDATTFEDSGAPWDAGPSDAGTLDAASIDTGRPDAGRRDCREIYGTAPSYLECAQRPDECEFYVDLDSATPSCADVCGAFGGMCLRSHADATGSAATCERLDDTIGGCADPHGDDICVCTR